MKRIKVHKFKDVRVDDEDFDKATAATLRWHQHYFWRKGKQVLRVTSHVYKDDGKQTTVDLHRFIAGLPQGKYVTFVSKDRRDMTRKNLKVGGKRIDLALPFAPEELDEHLTPPEVPPLTEPSAPVKLECSIQPDPQRPFRFVPDPNSPLGPAIQYKIWLKQQGKKL
jgi:hypothetical protein